MRPADTTLAPTNGSNGFSELFHPPGGGYYPRATPPPQAPTGPVRRINLGSLMRYKWSALSIFLALALPASAIAWLSHKPKYRSWADIEVPPIRESVINQGRQANAVIPLYRAHLATRAAEIRSQAVLGRVLDRKDVLTTRWYNEVPGSLFGVRPSRMERLMDQLEVRPQSEANFIRVAMETEYPKESKLLVEAVLEEYQAWSATQSADKDEALREVRDDNLEKFKRELATLGQKIEASSRTLGNDDPDVVLRILQEQRANLENKRGDAVRELDNLNRLIAMSQDNENRNDNAASKIAAELPAEVRYSLDSQWSQYTSELKRAEDNLNLQRERLGPESPRLAELQRIVNSALNLRQEREKQLDLQIEHGVFSPLNAGGGKGGSLGTLAQQRDLRAGDVKKLDEDLEKHSALSKKMLDEARVMKEYKAEFFTKKSSFDELQRSKLLAEIEGRTPANVDTGRREAFQPTQPSNESRRFMMVAMAIFGAAGISLALTFIRAMLNPQVRETSDVFDSTQGPLLGFVPLVPDPKTATPDQLAIQGEHYRMLRTSLLERLPVERGSILLITSAGPGAGKTTVTENLGRSFAQCGKRVLMIDGDLRRQTLCTRLKVRNTPGLVEVLQKSASDADAIIKRGAGEADVLPAGQLDSVQNSELLVSRAFRDLLQRWREKYDIVIVDAPPLLPVADARIMATCADGALMVVREGHCRRSEVTHAVAMLTQATRRFLGTVFLGANRSQNYPSYYSTYYGYGYAAPRPARDELVAVRRGRRPAP